MHICICVYIYLHVCKIYYIYMCVRMYTKPLK